MDYTNPFLNALLAALLGVLLVVWWSWTNPFEHRNWMLFVAVACAILGYHFGEPFIRILLAGR